MGFKRPRQRNFEKLKILGKIAIEMAHARRNDKSVACPQRMRRAALTMQCHCPFHDKREKDVTVMP